MSLITLGRSDAILAVHLIEMILYPHLLSPEPWERSQREDVEDLLEFIQMQLNSIAEEGVLEETP